MKSATVFLLAVTAFTLLLECSTAPADASASKVLDIGINADVGVEIQQQTRSGLSGIIGSLLVNGASAISKVTSKLETIVSNVGGIIKAISGKDTIKIDESVKQLVSETMVIGEASLARTTKLINDALLKAKGEDKKALTQVSEWLVVLEALRVKVYQGIRGVLESGSVKDIVKIVAEITVAIDQTEGEVAKWSKILPKGPVKVEFDKQTRIMLDSAIDGRDALQSLLTVPL